MCAKIACCIVLAAVLSVHGVMSNNLFKIQPPDRWEEAEIALADLIKQANLIMNTSMIELDLLQKEVLTISHDTCEAALEEIKELQDNVTKFLQDLKDQATTETQDVIDRCISLYGERMISIPIQTETQITNCVDHFKSISLKEIEKSSKGVQDTINIVGVLRNDIEGCRIATDSDECIRRVFVEILLAQIQMTTANEELIRRTRDLIDSYTESFPNCKIKAELALDEVLVLLGSLRECTGMLD